MSYLHIKRFIDDQIRILHTPLVIDDNIRKIMHEENISEAEMKRVLFKCNLQIKRQLRSKYSKQVVHQIVQQVAKAESAKLVKVSQGLENLASLLSPLALDSFSHNGTIEDRVRMINNLAQELPESRYLFAIYGSEKGKERAIEGEKEGDEKEEGNKEEGDKEEGEKEIEGKGESDLNEADESTQGLIREVQDSVNAMAGSTDAMIAQYDHLRRQFLEMNEQLLYKMEKLQYIEQLARKLGLGSDTGGDSDNEETLPETGSDLNTQLTRFGVLVEKLDLAMNQAR